MRIVRAASDQGIARAELTAVGQRMPAVVADGSDWGAWHEYFFPRLRDAVAPLVGYDGAEDVAQDTLLEVWGKWSGLPLERRTLEWMLRAARLRALSALHGDDEFVEASEELEESGQLGVTKMEIAEFESDLVMLAAKVAKRMTTGRQRMFALMLEGASNKQAAQRLSITFEYAKVLRKRVIADMRSAILRAAFHLDPAWAMRLLDARMNELVSREDDSTQLSPQDHVKLLPESTGEREEQHD
jgi:DNA-directed RNA polymerase specialized sigma24 family protein